MAGCRVLECNRLRLELKGTPTQHGNNGDGNGRDGKEKGDGEENGKHKHHPVRCKRLAEPEYE